MALAALAKVPINVVDRLMSGERRDPVLILCKAAGSGWPTVKAIFVLPARTARPRPARASNALSPIIDPAVEFDGAARRPLLADQAGQLIAELYVARDFFRKPVSSLEPSRLR